MRVIADLQLHSKYSRAVSPRMDAGEIYSWAVHKGIDLIATGDWTHPLWLRELKAKLVEDGTGFLQLKPDIVNEIRSTKFEIRNNIQNSNCQIQNTEPKFLLATEISSIYSQGGKARRIHNLIWAPSFATVDRIIAALNKRGCNLASDGRPIVGLSSRDIAELVLGIDESCLIIPAHIWTPWFSLYGSKSGFDSVEECFGDYAKYIYAIETGLSSDPVMNWRIGDLTHRAILSFSDAHSGPKLGREATVFELSEMTYDSLQKAIMHASDAKIPSSSALKVNKISCTFEFYPEEGKYHYTGHRLCGVKQTPEETKKTGVVCHVCGKPLTVGVMHRVEDLATSNVTSVQKSDANGVRWMYHPTDKSRPPYVNLVPLLEIIAEVLRTAATSFKVLTLYEKLVGEVGSEFTILLKADLEKVTSVAGDRVAGAIKKVRAGDIFIDPGFDGVFGKVKIWDEGEKETPLHPGAKTVTSSGAKKQMSLF